MLNRGPVNVLGAKKEGPASAAKWRRTHHTSSCDLHLMSSVLILYIIYHHITMVRTPP